MSRRGDGWDNAPVELFFGHMKEEIDLEPYCHLNEIYEKSKTILFIIIHRDQWNLKR